MWDDNDDDEDDHDDDDGGGGGESMPKIITWMLRRSCVSQVFVNKM